MDPLKSKKLFGPLGGPWICSLAGSSSRGEGPIYGPPTNLVRRLTALRLEAGS